MKVLITLTDVEPAVRLNALLEGAGIGTAMVSPMDDLPSTVRREQPDVIVVTGNLLDASTQSLVRQQLWDGAAVLGLADVGDRDLQHKLRSAGFTDVVTKPVPPEEVFELVKALLERRAMAERTGLYGESDPIREVLVKVDQIAPVSSTVLIEGESGTGKELVARAIHHLSPRRNKPFIAVNVGALPDTLLESELFGHEKGSFTGAAERRIGRFELADSGTLFLDEIGDVPHATQVKLLRVLEERAVTRVGGTHSIPVDVRVVTATNRSLRESVERGSFRSDLYYRLNVLSIYLPPLRERRSDIVLLVRRFVQEFSKQHDREFRGITPEAMQALVDYYWPGNVRELRNLVESMVVLSQSRAIGLEDIPQSIRDQGPPRTLPVHVGPIIREGERAGGRELEFIVRSLVELKLQVEELRRRVDDDRAILAQIGSLGWPADGVAGGPAGRGLVGPVGGIVGGLAGGAVGGPVGGPVGGLEPPAAAPAMNVVTVTPGMTMAQIERASIVAALRETGGNRRKAAELLAIGERTMYRKLKEYDIVVPHD